MHKKTITGHMVVKNEERWIWYSIMSVIDYLDQLIIFDNGSTDNTVTIIKCICNNVKYKNKIIFEEKKQINVGEFYKLRQEQIERTNTDFILVLDGDEIWWKNSIEEIIGIINDDEDVELIATKFIMCAGDIYHYRDFCRETYCIDKICGSITIRVMSKNIDGLHCVGYYGIEGYKDRVDRYVQNNGRKTIIMKNPYLHTSLLLRSSTIMSDAKVASRKNKFLLRNTWDYAFSKNFIYPEVFYKERPEEVASPWNRDNSILRVMIQCLLYIKKKFRKKNQYYGKDY